MCYFLHPTTPWQIARKNYTYSHCIRVIVRVVCVVGNVECFIKPQTLYPCKKNLHNKQLFFMLHGFASNCWVITEFQLYCRLCCHCNRLIMGHYIICNRDVTVVARDTKLNSSSTVGIQMCSYNFASFKGPPGDRQWQLHC